MNEKKIGEYFHECAYHNHHILFLSFSAMSLKRDIQGVHFHLNYGFESYFTLKEDKEKREEKYKLLE